jgi:hypothetical protein
LSVPGAANEAPRNEARQLDGIADVLRRIDARVERDRREPSGRRERHHAATDRPGRIGCQNAQRRAPILFRNCLGQASAI